jgi:predicted nucleic-acid-binding Zn-ribbon protein
MRKTGICPKCDHRHTLIIDRVAELDDTTTIGDARLAVVAAGTGLFGGTKLATAGALGAVVCRGCGFTELHVKDVAAIPVDGTLVRARTV